MKVFSPNALQEIRKRSNLTQKVLGKAVGASERGVIRWENGTFEPSATYLLRAMVLLGCAPEDLLADPQS